MNGKNIILYTIAGLVVFAIGGGCGVLYQQSKETYSSNILNSKLISAVSGKVIKVDGRNITIFSENESMVIKIKDGAQIYTPAKNSAGDTFSQSESLGNVKINDSVTAYIKFLPGGIVESDRLFIIN